jgi:hypothetical protein
MKKTAGHQHIKDARDKALTAAARRMRERLDGRSVDAIRAEASVFRGVRWPECAWERRAA